MSIAQTQSKHPLLSAKANGMFQLRVALLDHMSEDQADAVIKETDKQLTEYVRRHNVVNFAPFFHFLPKNDKTILLEGLHSKGGHATFIGRVELHHEVGDALIFKTEEVKKVVRKARKPRSTKPRVKELGFSFTELKTRLRDLDLKKLDPMQREMFHDTIATYLDFDRTKPMEFSFDLEVDDENVTLVTYRSGRRFNTSVFFFA